MLKKKLLVIKNKFIQKYDLFVWNKRSDCMWLIKNFKKTQINKQTKTKKYGAKTNYPAVSNIFFLTMFQVQSHFRQVRNLYIELNIYKIIVLI